MGAVGLALVGIFKNMLLSMASKAFLEWALFFIGDLIVKSTKTVHDDEFLAKLKAAYGEQTDGVSS